MSAPPREEDVDVNNVGGTEGSMKTVSEISDANFVLDHFPRLCSLEMYPYTQLHLGKTRSVAVAGPNFLVLESEYVPLQLLLINTASPNLNQNRETRRVDDEFR